MPQHVLLDVLAEWLQEQERRRIVVVEGELAHATVELAGVIVALAAEIVSAGRRDGAEGEQVAVTRNVAGYQSNEGSIGGGGGGEGAQEGALFACGISVWNFPGWA